MIGPFKKRPTRTKTKNIQRSRRSHASWFWIFRQISNPIKNVTNASGMSVRTNVAMRGLRLLRLNALSASKPAAAPNIWVAARNKRIVNQIAAIAEGKRHAKSHDRVTEYRPAEIHGING